MQKGREPRSPGPESPSSCLRACPQVKRSSFPWEKRGQTQGAQQNMKEREEREKDTHRHDTQTELPASAHGHRLAIFSCESYTGTGDSYPEDPRGLKIGPATSSQK